MGISSNSRELQTKSLNVSRSGKFYEKAKSRRVRHRDVLMSHIDTVQPVALKRSISESSKKKVWQEDDIDGRYEKLAQNRVWNITKTFNPSHKGSIAKSIDQKRNPQQRKSLPGKRMTNSRQQSLEPIQKKGEKDKVKSESKLRIMENSFEKQMHQSVKIINQNKQFFVESGARDVKAKSQTKKSYSTKSIERKLCQTSNKHNNIHEQNQHYLECDTKRQLKTLKSEHSSDWKFSQQSPVSSLKKSESLIKKRKEVIDLTDRGSDEVENDGLSILQLKSREFLGESKKNPAWRKKPILSIASSHAIKQSPTLGKRNFFLPVKRRASSRGIKLPPNA
mmetsp:Transcript_12431/g.19139  ORF Transcript_12431/g.19139 Transcript_12431/m.19139 type:complete len:336 (+) Transcript_12431:55-1062(+)